MIRKLAYCLAIDLVAQAPNYCCFISNKNNSIYECLLNIKGARGAGGPAARACRRCHTRPRACLFPLPTIGGGREEGTRASAGPLRSPFLPRAVRVDQPSGRHLASGGRARPVDQPSGRHLASGGRALNFLLNLVIIFIYSLLIKIVQCKF